ncbi:MAG: hypothetical protein H0T47_13280 [Planctomycetaceae bacterium]|nr:hypothetical protein [Planctomycetaceae bacterium]
MRPSYGDRLIDAIRSVLPGSFFPAGSCTAAPAGRRSGYRRRWGIEVFYRTAQQTLESATLRAARPNWP